MRKPSSPAKGNHRRDKDGTERTRTSFWMKDDLMKRAGRVALELDQDVQDIVNEALEKYLPMIEPRAARARNRSND